jgi:tripartite-type tricarboxylate transporter receptor subunit TctC
VACELFKLSTQTFAVHIPYRGSGPALTDLIGPVGMPPAVAQRISTDFAEVLRDPAIVQRVNGSGSVVRALPGPEFARFIGDEIRKWSSTARVSGTRLD